jgi:hypothetical protein
MTPKGMEPKRYPMKATRINLAASIVYPFSLPVIIFTASAWKINVLQI